MGKRQKSNREKKKKAVLSIKDKRRLKRERNQQFESPYTPEMSS